MKKNIMFNKIVIFAPSFQLQLLEREIEKRSYRIQNPGDDFNFLRKIKRKIFQSPHTHSYIFEGFYNASKYLGISTFWIDNQNNLEAIADSKTLIICEGSFLPDFNMKSNSKFVIHSIPDNLDNYLELSKSKKCLHLEIFKNEALNHLKIGDLSYFDNHNFTLYQPWATNLLPNQININEYFPKAENKFSYYIGMLYEEGVKKARDYNKYLKRSKKKTKIKCITGASHKTSQTLTEKSSICLDIRGDVHLNSGYVPCRIFKTLSYGREIYVNSWYIKKYLNHIPSVKFFNNGESLQNQYEQITSNQNYQNKEALEKRLYTLEFIKNNHTYVNRLKNIFKVFQ